MVVGEALYIYSNYALYNKGKIHNTYYTLFFFFGSVRSSRIANLRSSFCLSNEKCYRGHNIHLSISGQSQVILRPFSNLSQVSLSLLLQNLKYFVLSIFCSLPRFLFGSSHHICVSLKPRIFPSRVQSSFKRLPR